MNIAITAETTIDLTPELLKEFDIRTIPFTLILGEKELKDGEVPPEELFAFTDKTGKLPRTSAINQFQYEEFFREQLKDRDQIVHFALSSKISSACSQAIAASEEDEFKGKVFVVDTLSLSTGIALLAIYGSKLARIGKTGEEIAKACEERVPFDQASFSLESVNYLYKGGRCSMLSMLGANILKIKPEIFVKEGSMVAGAKYRGPMMKVVMDYVEDTLKLFPNPDKELAFITYSTAPDDVVAAVKERLLKVGFKRIETTHAGGTISCHCGPHCLGILYLNDGDHPLD